MRRAAGLCIVLLGIAACATKRSYVEKGNVLFQHGKYADAELNYRKAIQKDPNYGEAYYRLGLAAEKLSNATGAYNALFRASQLLPNHIEVKEKFGTVCLEYYLSDYTRPKLLYRQVQQTANELLSQNPNSFEGLRLKGYLAHEDRKPEDAISYLRKALQVKPGNPEVTTALVQSLLEDGRSQEAEQTALDLIGREKTYGPIYDDLYTLYLSANRLADAENILKRKVANNPKQANYIAQLASYYIREKNPTEARKTLQKLLDDSKDFPDAQLRVGDFYLAENDYPEAIRYYQEAEKSNPKDKAGLEKRSLVTRLVANQYDEAARLVDQILQEDPADEMALRMRADLLINTRKPENGAAAVQILQNLVNKHPSEPDPALRLNLGRAYLLKGDLGAARAEFEEALRQRKDFAEAQYELGRLYRERQEPAEALQAANAAVALRPSDRRARLLQAWGFANTGQTTKAQTLLDQLIKESPQDTQARLQLGVLYLEEANYRKAVDILEELRDSGDPNAMTNLAAAYVGLRRFDKALDTLSEALKQSPGNPAIREHIAETTALAGNLDFAIAQFQQLINQDPKSARLRLRLAELYAGKGDEKNSLLFFQQAHDLAPNEPTPALLYADALARAGRNGEAKTLFRQIVLSYPDNPPALNNAAFFLCDHGDLDEAQKLAERALQKAPGQPAFSDTLGYVYLKKGQRDNAIRTFSDLVRRYPTLALFHYHLGLALYEKGDRAAAKKELQKALTDHPGSTIQPRIKQLLVSLG